MGKKEEGKTIDSAFLKGVKSDNLPLSFMKFLEENEIDPKIYDMAHKLPRYVRVDPCANPVRQEDIEKELGTELKRVVWLNNFFELDGSIRIANSSMYKSGKIYGIDVSSGAAVAILNPQKGDHCLDLCCSPGAKLSMIANMACCKKKGVGSVTGVDISRERLASCKTVVQKYGLPHVRLFNADGCTFKQFPRKHIDSSGEAKVFFQTKDYASVERDCGNGKESALYDKVLVDAECTHDGSLKHIVKFNRWGWETFEKKFLDEKRISTVTQLQRDLLANGFELLKEGGELVYSTCSFSRKQNEEVVLWFLEKHKNSSLLPPGLPNLPIKAPMHQDVGRRINGTLRKDLEYMIRFDPLVSGTSGLFVAKIKKCTSSEAATAAALNISHSEIDTLKEQLSEHSPEHPSLEKKRRRISLLKASKDFEREAKNVIIIMSLGLSAEEVIKKLELTPHFEGGFFKETVRSDMNVAVTGEAKNGNRSCMTHIYYMLRFKDFSRLHKLHIDEIWHYYGGTSPIQMQVIHPGGRLESPVLGNDLSKGQVPFVFVPRGTWFGGILGKNDKSEQDFGLLGCTVAPAFDIDDFIVGEPASLIEQYPQHKDIILELTP
eukprot:Nk52_evm33s252 gene=Nk52_evmTU33s252